MSNCAYVSRSTGAFNVWSAPTGGSVIGSIYPGECFCVNGITEIGNRQPIKFRTASGALAQGYLDYSIKKASYHLYKVSNGALVANTRTSDGYYIHTIKSGYDMNWYNMNAVKQPSPLPAGTQLYFKGGADSSMYCGDTHENWLRFDGYKKPGGNFVSTTFFIDFMTLGTLVSNRVIL